MPRPTGLPPVEPGRPTGEPGHPGIVWRPGVPSQFIPRADRVPRPDALALPGTAISGEPIQRRNIPRLLDSGMLQDLARQGMRVLIHSVKRRGGARRVFEPQWPPPSFVSRTGRHRGWQPGSYGLQNIYDKRAGGWRMLVPANVVRVEVIDPRQGESDPETGEPAGSRVKQYRRFVGQRVDRPDRHARDAVVPLKSGKGVTVREDRYYRRNLGPLDGPVPAGFSEWLSGRQRFASASDASGSHSLFVYVKLSEWVADRYGSKAEDDSPPHVTVLYCGKQTAEAAGKARAAIEKAAEGLMPFGIEGRGKDHFAGCEDGGRKDAVYTPIRDGADKLAAARSLLAAAVRAAGVEWTDTHPEYKPHVTIRYVPTGDVDTVDPVEPWRDHVRGLVVAWGDEWRRPVWFGGREQFADGVSSVRFAMLPPGRVPPGWPTMRPGAFAPRGLRERMLRSVGVGTVPAPVAPPRNPQGFSIGATQTSPESLNHYHPAVAASRRARRRIGQRPGLQSFAVNDPQTQPGNSLAALMQRIGLVAMPVAGVTPSGGLVRPPARPRVSPPLSPWGQPQQQFGHTEAHDNEAGLRQALEQMEDADPSIGGEPPPSAYRDSVLNRGKPLNAAPGVVRVGDRFVLPPHLLTLPRPVRDLTHADPYDHAIIRSAAGIRRPSRPLAYRRGQGFAQNDEPIAILGRRRAGMAGPPRVSRLSTAPVGASLPPGARGVLRPLRPGGIASDLGLGDAGFWGGAMRAGTATPASLRAQIQSALDAENRRVLGFGYQPQQAFARDPEARYVERSGDAERRYQQEVADLPAQRAADRLRSRNRRSIGNADAQREMLARSLPPEDPVMRDLWFWLAQRRHQQEPLARVESRAQRLVPPPSLVTPEPGDVELEQRRRRMLSPIPTRDMPEIRQPIYSQPERPRYGRPGMIAVGIRGPGKSVGMPRASHAPAYRTSIAAVADIDPDSRAARALTREPEAVVGAHRTLERQKGFDLLDRNWTAARERELGKAGGPTVPLFRGNLDSVADPERRKRLVEARMANIDRLLKAERAGSKLTGVRRVFGQGESAIARDVTGQHRIRFADASQRRLVAHHDGLRLHGQSDALNVGGRLERLAGVGPVVVVQAGEGLGDVHRPVVWLDVRRVDSHGLPPAAQLFAGGFLSRAGNLVGRAVRGVGDFVRSRAGQVGTGGLLGGAVGGLVAGPAGYALGASLGSALGGNRTARGLAGAARGAWNTVRAIPGAARATAQTIRQAPAGIAQAARIGTGIAGAAIGHGARAVAGRLREAGSSLAAGYRAGYARQLTGADAPLQRMPAMPQDDDDQQFGLEYNDPRDDQRFGIPRLSLGGAVSGMLGDAREWIGNTIAPPAEHGGAHALPHGMLHRIVSGANRVIGPAAVTEQAQRAGWSPRSARALAGLSLAGDFINPASYVTHLPVTSALASGGLRLWNRLRGRRQGFAVQVPESACGTTSNRCS